MHGRIAVIGGANVDIGGFSAVPIIKGDSNPGRIRLSAGGVGRNIAETCARLGLEVQLITAIGCDFYGNFLQEDCRQKRIGLDRAAVTDRMSTSVYLFIDNSDGDMYCAVNDMAIQQLLTPEYLAVQLDMLNRCEAVVIDTNLPEESIVFLSEHLKVPVFADSVSCAKAEKLKNVLSHISCLKTNRLEAALLTGMTVKTDADAQAAAMALASAGVGAVYITLGGDGVLCLKSGKTLKLSYVSDRVVNATGAGDAFMAALVWAYTQEHDTRHSCIAGLAAAAMTVEAPETVSPELTRENLIKRMAIIEKLGSEEIK